MLLYEPVSVAFEHDHALISLITDYELSHDRDKNIISLFHNTGSSFINGNSC
jgi:hypothetical protein